LRFFGFRLFRFRLDAFFFFFFYENVNFNLEQNILRKAS